VRYQEFRYWSPLIGDHAVRLSMWDQHGREFFAIIQTPDSRGYRKIRRKTLDLIADAIEGGLEPGEIAFDG